MWVYRILILIVYYTHDRSHTREVRRPRGSAGALSGEDQSDAGALSGEDQSEVMGDQDFVSFGYQSQSRETMEYSAKSECDGAFERRRETSPLPPREPNSPVVKQDKYEQDMDLMKTAQGDLAVNMDQMETTQGDLAFMDTIDLIKQGQSAVATGSNNNNGEDKNGLEEKETTGAATPARLNLKYIIIHGMGSSHLLTNAAAQAYRTTTHTSSANEGGSGMSAADRLRQRLALGQTQGSVGEITSTGDPFRAIREQYGKDDDLVTSERGSTGGDGGDPGTGGEKPSTTGCFITDE